MKLSPRGKLLLLMGLFALPIVASVLAYNFADVRPTANYGELLVPPAPITAQTFDAPGGAPFTFGQLAGRWILVASDSGDCSASCREKLVTLRQVRLAVGRDAARVERVFVVDDGRVPGSGAMEPFAGMQVALAAPGAPLPAGVLHDPAHIYLVDPNGNVMMRWPWPPDTRRMIKDLERLLKASQIG